jgi:hypothetical protein
MTASDVQEGTGVDDGAAFAAVIDVRWRVEAAVVHGLERISVPRLRAAAAELGRCRLPLAEGASQVLEDLADRADRGEHPRPGEQIRRDLEMLLDLVRPAWWPAVDDPDPSF